jgi:hypothetical protein
MAVQVPHNVPHNDKEEHDRGSSMMTTVGGDLTCVFIGCVGDSMGDENHDSRRYGAGDGLRTRDPQLGRLML